MVSRPVWLDFGVQFLNSISYVQQKNLKLYLGFSTQQKSLEFIIMFQYSERPFYSDRVGIHDVFIWSLPLIDKLLWHIHVHKRLFMIHICFCFSVFYGLLHHTFSNMSSVRVLWLIISHVLHLLTRLFSDVPKMRPSFKHRFDSKNYLYLQHTRYLLWSECYIRVLTKHSSHGNLSYAWMWCLHLFLNNCSFP